MKGSSCSEQTKIAVFIYDTQTDKKDELHDWLRLRWTERRQNRGNGGQRIKEVAILPRMLQDGPRYFYSDIPDLDFRGKQKRTMHSLTRNIQQFCIINQLFETKKT